MASLAISAGSLPGMCSASSPEIVQGEVCGLRLSMNQRAVKSGAKDSSMSRMGGCSLRISAEDQTKMLDDVQAISGLEKRDAGMGMSRPPLEDRGNVTEAGSPQNPDADAAEGNGSARSIAEQLEDKYNNLRPDMQKLMEVKPDTLPTPLERRLKRRKEYWDAVSERDDRPFFAAVALFILVPPIAILGLAVAVGYVDFTP